MTNVTTDELREMIDSQENFVLLNALDANSFQKEHIPGSVNLDSKDKNFELLANKKFRDKNENIVVYCNGSTCNASKRAAEKLENEGFINVQLYEGGIEEWKSTGNKLDSQSEAA